MESFIPQSLRLVVVGVNHRTASLELRESLAFTPERAAEACRQFQAKCPRAELVILSTCNRVECYLARPVAGEPTVESVGAFLAEFHNIPAEQLRPHLYHREDRAAVEHLFAVTSSLDSMVVGETQILGQVKQAYQQACDAGSIGAGDNSGKVLHALFQRAIAAAKEVHDTTRLAAGRLSIASVAVDLAASVFDRFDDKTIVCVGAGKMATLLLRHLSGLKPGNLIVTNRSFDRAQQLAAQFAPIGAEAKPFESLDALLAEADILLTSTGAEEPIVTEARFRQVLKARRYRPLVIVDIAVPRDVEPSIGKLSNVYLYNVDDLQEVAAGNRGKRESEITAAQQVLAGHVDEFIRWFAGRNVGPLVKALYEQSHAQAKAELEVYFSRNPQLDAQQRAEMERLTHRLIGKLLHGPVTQLTAQTEATGRPLLAAAVRKLFEIQGNDAGNDEIRMTNDESNSNFK